jgi:four helix bundle protein
VEKGGESGMDKPHKRLEVWKESIEFVVIIYDLARKFPRSEEFVLTPQLKRAVISIAANIAEGAARHSKREFIQFLYIARGSMSEVDTYLEIALRLGIIGKEVVSGLEPRMTRIDKMLTGLIQFLKKKS